MRACGSFPFARFEDQEKSTSGTIAALTAKLQELAAALTDLRARQQTLGSEVPTRAGCSEDLAFESGSWCREVYRHGIMVRTTVSHFEKL